MSTPLIQRQCLLGITHASQSGHYEPKRECNRRHRLLASDSIEGEVHINDIRFFIEPVFPLKSGGISTA